MATRKVTTKSKTRKALKTTSDAHVQKARTPKANGAKVRQELEDVRDQLGDLKQLLHCARVALNHSDAHATDDEVCAVETILYKAVPELEVLAERIDYASIGEVRPDDEKGGEA